MSIDLDPRSLVRRRATVPAGSPEVSPPPTTPEPPRMPGRRNPRWIALGVIALCLGGLLSYAIYARVATDTSVVAVNQTVYRGELIEAADLTRIVIQGASFPQAVPADRLSELVGQRASFDLPAGTVLSQGSVTATTVPVDGRAVVGLKVDLGRAPAALLLPSSPVRLVALPPPAADTGTSDKLAGKTYLATVIDQAPAPDGTSILVNLDVDASQAPTIALLASQDRIAVVRDAGR